MSSGDINQVILFHFIKSCCNWVAMFFCLWFIDDQARTYLCINNIAKYTMRSIASWDSAKYFNMLPGGIQMIISSIFIVNKVIVIV